MTLSDNSNTERARRIKQRTQAAFRRAYPTRPEQSPRPGTDASIHQDTVQGLRPYVKEQADGAVVITCCGGDKR